MYLWFKKSGYFELIFYPWMESLNLRPITLLFAPMINSWSSKTFFIVWNSVEPTWSGITFWYERHWHERSWLNRRIRLLFTLMISGLFTTALKQIVFLRRGNHLGGTSSMRIFKPCSVEWKTYQYPDHLKSKS